MKPPSMLPAARRVVRQALPRGARNPQAVIRGANVWMVFVVGSNAYSEHAADGGTDWSRPVRINSIAGSVNSAMERGPRIALGADDVLQVVWQPNFPPGGNQVWYAQSTDRGTFTPQIDIRKAPKGYDEPNITADAEGNVYAFWLDGRLGPRADSPVASPLFYTQSHDNGKTWGAATMVKSDYPGNWCGCCMPRPFIGLDGQLYVAARGGYHNIRDIWLLHRLPDNRWKATRVSYNSWVIQACPMSGPAAISTKSGIAVAWMSKGQAFWSEQGADGEFPIGGTPLAPPGFAPANGANYPLVLTDQQGDVCLAWNQGGHVYWIARSPRGVPLGSGDLGAGVGDGPGAERAAGFVTPGGQFRVLF
ncbi:MAG TPA: sialidase family protein [Armatimonadota bacterium]|nr:sialidase family protein [Armatimonadota bacterium]